MKKEIEGTMVHEKGEPAIETDDGKVKLVYNLFDGYSGKRVKITVEEVEKEEDEEEEEQEE